MSERGVNDLTHPFSGAIGYSARQIVRVDLYNPKDMVGNNFVDSFELANICRYPQRYYSLFAV